jgi:hypothetical protein
MDLLCMPILNTRLALFRWWNISIGLLISNRRSPSSRLNELLNRESCYLSRSVEIRTTASD